MFLILLLKIVKKQAPHAWYFLRVTRNYNNKNGYVKN